MHIMGLWLHIYIYILYRWSSKHLSDLLLPIALCAVFYPMALYETAHSPPKKTRLLMYATSGFMLAVCILATLGSFYAFTQV